MLTFYAGLELDSFGLVGKRWVEQLEDYDFIVFEFQPDSRTVESELRASVPVSA